MRTAARRLAASMLAAAACAAAAAQNTYAFENIFYNIDTARSRGDILLHVDYRNFFKNNEYFGDYAEGYTLPGYRATPSAIAYAADNVSIEAGVLFMGYDGSDKTFDEVRPVLTAQWRFHPKFNLIFGCLDNSRLHHLPEAIYDPEHLYSGMPEMGLQLKIDAPKVDADVWLDWQHFIYHGDDEPERFTAGIGARWHLTADSSAWRIDVPTIVTVSHIGGQISDYEERMQSLANANIALEIGRENPHAYLRKWQLAVRSLFFYVMTGTDVRPFEHGVAFNPELLLQTKRFELAMGYFAARDFYALHGNPIFMSLSNYKPDVYNQRRNMATARLCYNKGISRTVRFSIGASAYYDIDESQMEYSYHVHMVISPSLYLRELSYLIRSRANGRR